MQNGSGIHCLPRKERPEEKVDFEIYKSILYNLEIRKVYLDSKLSLEKFSSIVGTNTTYLSNAVNNYFGCNFKRLINSYRVVRAKELLDGKDCPVNELFSRCGFALQERVLCGVQKSSWHDSPAIYIAESESFYDSTQLSPFITINIFEFLNL